MNETINHEAFISLKLHCLKDKLLAYTQKFKEQHSRVNNQEWVFEMAFIFI